MFEVSSVMQFVFVVIGGLALGFGFGIGSILAGKLFK